MNISMSKKWSTHLHEARYMELGSRYAEGNLYVKSGQVGKKLLMITNTRMTQQQQEHLACLRRFRLITRNNFDKNPVRS